MRSRATSGTTPGREIAGRAGAAPTPGRSSSRRTPSAASSTCRSRRRFRATTAATGRARTCTAMPSSRSRPRPASTSGTSRLSTTTCGTPTPRRRRRCSTSPARAARSRPSGVTTKSGYLYILNRETGRADLRRRGAGGGGERRAGRGSLSDPAVPGEAAADGARPLRRGRHRDGRGHVAGARRGVLGAGRQPRRDLQRGAVHPLDLPARGRGAADHAELPGRCRRPELGRRLVRSGDRLRLRLLDGRRRAGLDGRRHGRRRAVAVREADAAAGQLRGQPGRPCGCRARSRRGGS